MKLTFKVRLPGSPVLGNLTADTAFSTQDLKQEKFMIEVEPTETVCDDTSAAAAPIRSTTPRGAGLINFWSAGSRSQGEDRSRKRRI